MKINVIPALIAAAISALLAYALFAFGVSHRLIMAIGGFLCFFDPRPGFPRRHLRRRQNQAVTLPE